MPMRWTPENDQLLLLKILETHDLSVDTKRVADAWPVSMEEGKQNDRPTPRAITERLVRMRSIVKTTGTGTDGHFSIGKGTGSVPSTPRKPRGAGLKTPSASSSGKRKRSGLGDSPRTMEDRDTPTKRPLRPSQTDTNCNNNDNDTVDQVGVTLKLEGDDEEGLLDQKPALKRERKASRLAFGMVSYKDEEDEESSETESSASEYTPDKIREENEDLYA